MSKKYVEDTVYKGSSFADRDQLADEYDGCTFINCVFSNCELQDVYFTNCEFDNCDLSMAKLNNTAFRDVKFKNCKLLGLHFDDCNNFLLSFTFEDCVLNFSSFYKLKLKNIHFKNCILEEVEFVESDLTNSTFANCDLVGTLFKNTILEKADLRTSYNYSINPETNRIKKAKFSIQGIVGLLDAYDIEIEV